MHLVAPRSAEARAVELEVAKPFAIGRFEVSRAEWSVFVGQSGVKLVQGCQVRMPEWKVDPAASWASPGFPQDDQHPVTCISHADAVAYAAWLSKRTGKTYRLPTDAEWHLVAAHEVPLTGPEEQCRHANGADESAKSGDGRRSLAPCRDGFDRTAPVGSLAPTGRGLSDLFGNVWEWVETCPPDFSGPVPSFPACTPEQPRLLRGGSWNDPPALVSLDARMTSPPDVRDHAVGFRLVRDLDPKEVGPATAPPTASVAADASNTTSGAARVATADIGSDGGPNTGPVAAPAAAQPEPVPTPPEGEVVGEVALMSGEATAMNAGTVRALSVAARVYVGDLISTGANGRLQVKIGRRTVLRLGERTEIGIERQDADGKTELAFFGGAIGYEQSGSATEPSVVVRSDYSAISPTDGRLFAGISRGVFAVYVERGRAKVTAGKRTVDVSAERGIEIGNAGAEPGKPAKWAAARVKEALASVRVQEPAKPKSTVGSRRRTVGGQDDND